MSEIALQCSELNNLCRICLASNDLLVNIYTYCSQMNSCVYESLLRCAPVQISHEDELPWFMCRYCYSQLVQFTEFQKKAVETEKTLRRYLEKLKIDQSAESVQERVAPIKLRNIKELLDSVCDANNDTEAIVVETTADRLECLSETRTNDDVRNEERYAPVKVEIKEESNTFRDSNSFPAGGEPATDQQVVRSCSEDVFNCSESEAIDDREIKVEVNEIKQEADDDTINCKQNDLDQSLPPQTDPCVLNYYLERSDEKVLVKRVYSKKKETYSCDMCDQTFRQPGELMRHVNIHAGKNPYKCDICDKCFAQKIQLIEHKISHSDKRFQCKICKKLYAQERNLNYHMKLHAERQPCKCDFCDGLFLSTRSLNLHMRLCNANKKHSKKSRL